MIKVRNL